MEQKAVKLVLFDLGTYLAVLGLGIAGFVFFYPVMGGAISTVLNLPAMLAGWHWRIRGSIIGSVVSMVILAVLFRTMVDSPSASIPPEAFLNYLIMAISAFLVGLLRSMQKKTVTQRILLEEKEKQLQKEIQIKSRIEDQLALAMDYLESEISQTRNKLDSTSKALDERHRLLEVAEQSAIKSLRQLRVVLDTFGIMFINFDLGERRILQVSRASEEIYGFEEKDFIEDPELWLERIIMEDRKPVLDFLESGKEVRGDFSVRALHLNGELKWLSVKLIAVTDDNQGGRLYGLIQDITETKQNEQILRSSLEEKDALIKEVHHRVKNNLQIIVSLMNLEKHKIADQNALETVEMMIDRFQSMAALHENVYITKNLMHVDLSVYLRGVVVQALSEAQKSSRLKLDFSLEPVFAPLDVAIPCGMVFHDAVRKLLEIDSLENRVLKISLVNEPETGLFGLSFDPPHESLDDVFSRDLIPVYLKQLNAESGTDGGSGVFVRFPGTKKHLTES